MRVLKDAHNATGWRVLETVERAGYDEAADRVTERSPRRRAPGRRSALSLSLPLGYLLALGMLLVAWAIANPPGMSPDENSHYIRSLGAAQGNIFGSPGGYSKVAGETDDDVKRVNAYTRSYPVPANMTPPTNFGCNRFNESLTAACEYAPVPASPAGSALSPHAAQPPLPYLLAGPVMIHESTPNRADYAGRLVLAFACWVVIAFPLLLLRRYRARATLALIAGVTPMAVFVGSTLNPSGLEIFSSIGLFLSLLAVGDGAHPRLALVATAFTGAVLEMSRPFAPLWTIVSLVSIVGLVGPRESWQAVRRHLVGSIVTAGVIFIAAMSTLLFVRHYGSAPTVPVLSLGPGQLETVFEGSVGNFAWLDSPLPTLFAAHWVALLGVFTLVAFAVGDRRERITVALVTFLVWAGTYELILKFLLPNGVGPQGRHFLPILVLQPLTCAFVLAKPRGRARFLVGSYALAMAALQVIGWLCNSTRQSLAVAAPDLTRLPHLVGRLLSNPPWAPPGGFGIWLVLVLVSGVLLALVSIGAVKDLGSEFATPSLIAVEEIWESSGSLDSRQTGELDQAREPGQARATNKSLSPHAHSPELADLATDKG